MSEAAKPARRWVPWLVLGGVGTAIAVGVGLYVRSSSRAAVAQEEKPPVAVTVEPVTLRPVRRTVSVVGSLYGRDEITLTPKIDGPVVELFCDVGDTVKPGQALVQIDPTDYQLAVDEARRALDLELARLGLEPPAGPLDEGKRREFETRLRQFDIKALPMVVRAAALRQNASDKRARVYAINTSTPEERQQADTDEAVGLANYRQALLDAETGRATVRQRLATLATAEQRLRDTRIVAPIPQREKCDADTPLTEMGYVVTQRSVAKGEMVRNGFATPLLKLVLEQTLKLQAQLPERYIGVVSVGQAVELDVEAYPGRRFSGRVARINPSVDRVSRTFTTEIQVPNGERRLRAGCFVRADILLAQDAQALTVPDEAIVTFAGVTKVFVVSGDVVREVKVQPGGAVEVGGDGEPRRWVEVQGDLASNARVVTSGQSQLADGVAVRVRETKTGGK
jgi:RND family efflux transporter MFP subunit